MLSLNPFREKLKRSDISKNFFQKYVYLEITSFPHYIYDLIFWTPIWEFSEFKRCWVLVRSSTDLLKYMKCQFSTSRNLSQGGIAVVKSLDWIS